MENSIQNKNIKNIDFDLKKNSIDINLNDLIGSVLRRKIYFFSVFVIFLALGYLKTLDKPIWQGEFQIVIRSKKDSAGGSLEDLKSGGGGSILSLLNMGGLNNNLKTEVKILESSSILNPIFNFVKGEKKLKSQNSKIKFKNWKDSLSVNLVEGTSVLNLKYRDTDKELIIPVLNKLSNAYQKYSNRDKQITLLNGIDYLEEQSQLLKKTSQNSLDELMKFNIENNFFSASDINSPEIVDYSGDNALPFNFNSSADYAPNGTKLILLSQLEALALEKSSIFKKESAYMSQLNQRIKSLKDSISKPTETLIKYRNLRRKAMMDEILYTNIEKQLEILKLEKAKQETPWELISAPTMMEDPVSPGPLRIMAITILLGAFFGTISSLVIDRRSKLIFNFTDINRKIPYLFIRKIKAHDKENFRKLIRFLFKKNTNLKELVFIPVSDELFKKEVSNELDFLNQKTEDRKVIISNDFENNKDKKHLLIIRKSKSSFIVLEEYLKDIQLLSISVLGWIFLEE